MKVKFRNFSRRALGKYRPFSIADLPEAEAMVFLNNGLADPVKEASEEKAILPIDTEETAAVPVSETEIKVPVENISGKKKKKKKRK
jgi:hypothetical protein